MTELISDEQLDDTIVERPIAADEDWLGRMGTALLDMSQIAAEGSSSGDPRVSALAARISKAADETIAEVVEVSDALEDELASSARPDVT